MYGIFKLIKEHFKDKVYVPEISSWGAAAISSFFSFCENSFSKEVSTVAKNTGFMRFPYTHIRRHSVRTNTCKASLWSFFFLLPPAGLDTLAEARRTLTLAFPCWQGVLCLFQESVLTNITDFWDTEAFAVSLAFWPTSSSTLMQTKIDSIIYPRQSNKNVNKEQKLPVLRIIRGPLREQSFRKTDPAAGLTPTVSLHFIF